MGRDKTLAPFLGRPLIQWVVDRLSGLADELFLVTNRPDDFRFLGVRMVRDVRPGRGVIGGLYTALWCASVDENSTVAVVACDMPFVNSQLLSAAHGILIHENYDGVVPCPTDGNQPLHAVYRRSTCLPAVETALDKNLWRVNSWFQDVRIRFLNPEEIQLYDPNHTTFININTEEDLVHAERLALSGVDPFYSV